MCAVENIRLLGGSCFSLFCVYFTASVRNVKADGKWRILTLRIRHPCTLARSTNFDGLKNGQPKGRHESGSRVDIAVI